MGSKYQAYPGYKDSGVEWLGEAPAHWKTIPIGRLFRRTKRAEHTDKELLSVYRDFGVIPTSSRDDNNNKPSEDLSPYQLVEPNDLVMNKMKAWQGSIAISEYEGIVSPAYFVYQPLPKLFDVAYPKYIHYLLRHPIYIAQYLRQSKGIRVNQWDLDPDEFQRIELLLPEKNEQINIFRFLDHETAKIDTLIEKQQQLIKLLKEKRQAVISHAVTKGLNPNAKMRDSGVEWLGEVPEHWEMLKGGFIGKLFGSESIADDDVKSEGDIPFIKVSTLSSEGFELHIPAFFVDRTVGKQLRTSINYVVFPKRGAAIFTNKVNIVKVDSLIDPNLMGWDIGNKAKPQFIAYLLKLRGLDDIADISTVPQINNKHIEPIKFPVPPISEQREIIDFLSHKINQLADLINKTQLAIELVQERRTALISAAVTGKIDVRNWQAPNG
ncbi:restriction endonuclease subunit S [Nitrosomonas sp.]|uniref:restriction endonuclease subunit S n=1 Tax=Nitrosomonas sp. TaxID=42353 RepID=UPI0027310940|nr:restriction endonuclease subunit S [Nitrosomonas sp.]MDP2225628.1 restriction endonuclease subunit S [Nitrosomonas sp.]